MANKPFLKMACGLSRVSQRIKQIEREKVREKKPRKVKKRTSKKPNASASSMRASFGQKKNTVSCFVISEGKYAPKNPLRENIIPDKIISRYYRSLDLLARA